MTANQIAYNKHLEDKRHNYVTETETIRHNKVTETETGRHNIAQEIVANRQLLEGIRHNYASEKLQKERNANDFAVGMNQVAATRYAAELNARTQREVAQINASASRYAADANAAATRYSASVNASTSILNTSSSNANRIQTAKINSATSKDIQSSREKIAAADRRVQGATAIGNIVSNILGSTIRVAGGR